MMRYEHVTNQTADEMKKVKTRLKVCLLQVDKVGRMKRNFEQIFQEIQKQEMKTVELEGQHNQDIMRVETVLEQ